MSEQLQVTRCQDFGTITDCIVDAAKRSAAGELTSTIRVFAKGSLLGSSGFVELSWAELHSKSKAMAHQLRESGVVKGSHVAILGNTSLELIAVIQAVWLCGATVVIVPLPYRLSTRERFIEDTRARLSDSDASHLVIDSEIARVAKPKKLVEGSPVQVVKLGDLSKADPGDNFEVAEPNPEDLAILQFTSGTTSAPKGVMLAHKNLVANMDAITAGGDIDPNHDLFVSWLPLHHDMGLIGMLTYSMTHGVSLVKSSPADFLSKPGRWMEWISEFGGSITAGPNFSYALAARNLKSSKEVFDLTKLRIALNGAEPVSPATVSKFIEAGERHGLKASAVFPAFGMAETCIAGSFGKVGQGIRIDHVSSDSIELEQLAKPVSVDDPDMREMVALGHPVQGLQFRIVDKVSGAVLDERQVGELQISGSSLFGGYYKNDQATKEVLGGGWFSTGDLGYLVNGELYICGRIKDVIIVGGRNIYPQDIEAAVDSLPEVRSGNVIAFSVEGNGKESVVVVAETKEKSGFDEIRSAIKEKTVGAVGVPANSVVLVKPSTLPKTSSGKVQRSKCKQQFLDQKLQIL